MSQVIIFQNDNGGVATCIPTGEISIEDVLEKDVPKGRGGRIVENTELPFNDNDFYDAWEMDDTKVWVNIEKAREITKNRLRMERAPLLAALDVQFQRALEEGKPTTAIVAEKNRLRDITTLADTCTTTAELRALTVEA